MCKSACYLFLVGLLYDYDTTITTTYKLVLYEYHVGSKTKLSLSCELA